MLSAISSSSRLLLGGFFGTMDFPIASHNSCNALLHLRSNLCSLPAASSSLGIASQEATLRTLFDSKMMRAVSSLDNVPHCGTKAAKLASSATFGRLLSGGVVEELSLGIQ
jgi:hypothetical protein